MPRVGNPKRDLDAGRTGPRIVLRANATLQLLLLPASLVLPAIPALSARALLPLAAVSMALSLVVLALIDARTRTLPRSIVRPLYAGGLAYALLAVQARFPGDASAFAGQLASSLAVGAVSAGAIVALSALMQRMHDRHAVAQAGGQAVGEQVVHGRAARGRAACERAAGEQPARGRDDPPVGAGDVRLIGALGLAFGGGLLPILLVACAGACAYALALRSKSFPFGPFLAAPALVALCAGAFLGLP